MGESWRVVETVDSRREWEKASDDSIEEDSAHGRVAKRGREGLTIEARAKGASMRPLKVREAGGVDKPRRLRFMLPFHQFLTALSLRFPSRRAISAQRLPISLTMRSIMRPSSAEIGSRLSEGLRFWWKRSRHCLGER